MKKGIIFLSAVFVMFACQSKKNNETKIDEEQSAKKQLIIYYSQTGVTEKLANVFAKYLNADILRIDIEQPYNGSYEETIDRCKKEMENNELSKIASFDIDLSKYDTIFLGYSVWFGTYARPIMSLINDYNFDGKTIVPFCSFGSGGLYESAENLKNALSNSTILNGFGIREARIEKANEEVERFLIENGHIEGTIEALPEYGETLPVSEEDIKIFDAACSDYKYPLGKPLLVSKRTTNKSNDFCFTVEGNNNAEWSIYITVDLSENAKPEFTLVSR